MSGETVQRHRTDGREIRMNRFLDVAVVVLLAIYVTGFLVLSVLYYRLAV